MSSRLEHSVTQVGEDRPRAANVATLRGVSSVFSSRSLLRWEFSYVLVLLVWAFTGRSEILKAVSNTFALLFVVRVAWVLISRAGYLERSSRVLAFFVILFGAANLVVNATHAQFTETIKILSVFMFYFAGETMGPSYFERRPSFTLSMLFVFVPLLTALVDLYRVGGGDGINEQPLSIFANRNNAVAFAVVASWTLLHAGVRRSMIVGYLVASVVAFKTLGALVAIAIALYLIYLGPGLIGLVIASSFAYFFFDAFGDKFEILTRAQTAWHSLGSVLADAGGVWGLAKADYAQIYMAAGTSDISLIFRLKHWVNLIYLYQDASPIHQLFGLGVGSSEALTEMRLVPHCDYLRFIFELGPGVFACFAILNFTIVRRLGGQFLSIPVVFLCIYFFSDNLVTNLPVMSLFYFTAGAIVSSARRS